MSPDYNAHYNWVYAEYGPSEAYKVRKTNFSRRRDDDDFFAEYEEVDYYEY